MVLQETVAAILSSNELGYGIVRALLVILVTYLAAKGIDRVIRRYFDRATQRSDTKGSSYLLFRRIVTVAVYLVGLGVAVYAVPQIRQMSVALFASAGFIGIVLGLAAQSALSNVISGVFLILFQPFRIGDMIDTQEHYGWVEDITLRHTVIETPANERVVIPNAQISDDYIVNYSLRETKCRYSVEAGIAYGSDIDRAREIMLDVAGNHPDTYSDESEVIVSNLGESSVVMELRVWGKNRMAIWRAAQEIREDVKKRFDDEDSITIPFPQRTVSYLDKEEPDGPRPDAV